VALITHLILVPRLKKEFGYTNTPPLCLHGRLRFELCFSLLTTGICCFCLPPRASHFLSSLSRQTYPIERLTDMTLISHVCQYALFMLFLAFIPTDRVRNKKVLRSEAGEEYLTYSKKREG
jgi:hypothetical protein